MRSSASTGRITSLPPHKNTLFGFSYSVGISSRQVSDIYELNTDTTNKKPLFEL